MDRTVNKYLDVIQEVCLINEKIESGFICKGETDPS